jgi:hypothetical protein
MSPVEAWRLGHLSSEELIDLISDDPEQLRQLGGVRSSVQASEELMEGDAS